MPKKRSSIAHRAWKILRLALLWARKGEALRRRLVMDLRLLPKFLKNLRHSTQHNAMYYRERELSFDDTPIIRIKMHRPSSMRFRFPCINPEVVDFDYDFEYNDNNDEARNSFLEDEDHEDVHDCEVCEEIVPYDDDDNDEGIDLKAEEFINKFYNQLKLQRQISYLQYNEMLNRGVN